MPVPHPPLLLLPLLTSLRLAVLHCPLGGPLPSRSLSVFAASTATAIASTARLLLPRPAAPCRGLPFHSFLFSRRRPRRAVDASSAAAGGGGGGAAKEPPRTVFPGGFKRLEIQVPALVPRVGADEALGLWRARVRCRARALKAAVGDRACLLIAERVNVASAFGASGVVLADDGIPVIVGRSMMMKSNSDPIYLPLVARTGEFNLGKSTFINALLRRHYLQEGVVPTTNEITLLSYSEVDSESLERCERHPDGQFMCYLSAPILKEMNPVIHLEQMLFFRGSSDSLKNMYHELT